MPVKWTPENDQLLLLKILETHDLSVDTKKVAEAWPASDVKDKPTPRAITERLVRMRQSARASSGNAGFAIKSAPTTPKKPRNNNTSTSASGKTKRARSQKADVDNATEDEDMADAETPTKPNRSVKMEPESKAIKLELAELGGGNVRDVPAKRARKNSALPLGMVEYECEKWEEDETVYDSSASEFVPEDGVKR